VREPRQISSEQRKSNHIHCVFLVACHLGDFPDRTEGDSDDIQSVQDQGDESRLDYRESLTPEGCFSWNFELAVNPSA
jgi:hypothetical protein